MDTDYFDELDDTKEKQARIKRCGWTEKPASDMLLSLEEERRVSEILNPLLF